MHPTISLATAPGGFGFASLLLFRFLLFSTVILLIILAPKPFFYKMSKVFIFLLLLFVCLFVCLLLFCQPEIASEPLLWTMQFVPTTMVHGPYMDSHEGGHVGSQNRKPDWTVLTWAICLYCGDSGG